MIQLVIVYDIVDDKRRRLVGDILEGFGKRVNRSVFECSVKNKNTRVKLEKALENEIDSKVDSLRIYSVCLNCVVRSSVVGDEPNPFEKDAIYFF